MKQIIPTLDQYLVEAKIALDKYYTPDDTALRCINKTYEVIGRENITEIIEPSAGGGAFSKQIPGCIAYDLVPEYPGVIKQDFLKLKLPYKEGRLFIGNPPFGERNKLSMLFYKHAVDMGDFIAFILPISQYQNNQQMHEFDLIYSEDLGDLPYSERPVHCCFNIYKRNEQGLLPKKDYTLNDVTIKTVSRGRTKTIPTNYDYAICAWGDSSIGKEVEHPGQYAEEVYFTINNEKIRDEILNLLKTTNWKTAFKYTAAAKLQAWKLYKFIKEQIPRVK